VGLLGYGQLRLWPDAAGDELVDLEINPSMYWHGHATDTWKWYASFHPERLHNRDRVPVVKAEIHRQAERFYPYVFVYDPFSQSYDTMFHNAGFESFPEAHNWVVKRISRLPKNLGQ